MGKLKSSKEILESIGFNKDSRESTQMAFLRFLKKEISLTAPVEAPSALPEQLEFDLGEHGPRSWSSEAHPKKVSNS